MRHQCRKGVMATIVTEVIVHYWIKLTFQVSIRKSNKEFLAIYRGQNRGPLAIGIKWLELGEFLEETTTVLSSRVMIETLLNCE